MIFSDQIIVICEQVLCFGCLGGVYFILTTVFNPYRGGLPSLIYGKGQSDAKIIVEKTEPSQINNDRLSKNFR